MMLPIEKREEEESLKLQKLESLSVLAGGIAHDFNNILTIIVSNLSLAEMYLEDNPKVFDIISSAQKASFRASDLINQLRTFSKGSSLIKVPVLFNKFLQESVLFALRGSNILSEFDFSDDVYLEIDESQISQVVNNLVINAKQAMSDGGNIKVITQRVNVKIDKSAGLKRGDYLKISIIDTGVGIPKKDMDKIFDPYFTTKVEGNGLGLATSYSIIQKHGGLIEVQSILGKGTKFDIYLPIESNDFFEQNQFLNNSDEFAGYGKLLLMDDEEEIRWVFSKMLNKVGYKVDSVKNGVEAIAAYKKAKSEG